MGAVGRLACVTEPLLVQPSHAVLGGDSAALSHYPRDGRVESHLARWWQSASNGRQSVHGEQSAIDIYTANTPNGQKIHIMLEETGLACRTR